jgi:hypothetical protein
MHSAAAGIPSIFLGLCLGPHLAPPGFVSQVAPLFSDVPFEESSQED